LKPVGNRSKECPEEIRLIRIAEEEIASSTPILLRVISILEHMPDRLNMDVPILGFNPFKIVSDDLLSSPTAKESTEVKSASRMFDIPNFSTSKAVHSPLDLSLPKPSRLKARSRNSTSEQNSSAFETPSVFSFRSRRNGDGNSLAVHGHTSASRPLSHFDLASGSQKDKPRTIGDSSSSTAAEILCAGRPDKSQAGDSQATSNKETPRDRKQNISQSVSRESTAIAEARFNSKPSAMEGEGGLGVISGSALRSLAVNSEVDAAVELEVEMVVPQDLKQHDNLSTSTHGITKTILLIDQLADSLSASSIEDADNELSYGSVLSNEVVAEWAHISAAKADTTVTELKQHSFGSLDTQDQLAVHSISSLADSILSHYSTGAAPSKTLEKRRDVYDSSSRNGTPRQSRVSPDTRLSTTATAVSWVQTPKTEADHPKELGFNDKRASQKYMPTFNAEGLDEKLLIESKNNSNLFNTGGVTLAGSLADSVLSADKDRQSLQSPQSPQSPQSQQPTKSDDSAADIGSSTTVSQTKRSSNFPMTGSRNASFSSKSSNADRVHADSSQTPKAVASFQGLHQDNETLATLVNEILIKQARRHGVDLS
jgi:hypothetical protein